MGRAATSSLQLVMCHRNLIYRHNWGKKNKSKKKTYKARLTFFRGCHFIIFVNQNGTALRYYMRMECRFKEIQSASHAASPLPSVLQQIFSKKRCMMMCESQLCGNLGCVCFGGETAQSTQIIHRLNPQLSPET